MSGSRYSMHRGFAFTAAATISFITYSRISKHYTLCEATNRPKVCNDRSILYRQKHEPLSCQCGGIVPCSTVQSTRHSVANKEASFYSLPFQARGTRLPIRKPCLVYLACGLPGAAALPAVPSSAPAPCLGVPAHPLQPCWLSQTPAQPLLACDAPALTGAAIKFSYGGQAARAAVSGEN